MIQSLIDYLSYLLFPDIVDKIKMDFDFPEDDDVENFLQKAREEANVID